MYHQKVFRLIVLLLLGLLAVACEASEPETTQEPGTGLANPASVYCEEQGGTLELREDSDGGVYGVCIFPDGSECEEWAYFNGECRPGMYEKAEEGMGKPE